MKVNDMVRTIGLRTDKRLERYVLISLGLLGGNTSFGLSPSPSFNSLFIALMVAGMPFS
jgi:hypothetical protein